MLVPDGGGSVCAVHFPSEEVPNGFKVLEDVSGRQLCPGRVKEGRCLLIAGNSSILRTNIKRWSWSCI